MTLDLHHTAQRRVLHRAVDAVVDHGRRVPGLPVTSVTVPEDVRRLVAMFDLENGADPELVIDEVATLLESSAVLTTHPRYFGLFNPSPLSAGIAADILTAGFNPQLAVWSHAPAAVEIEARVIDQVGRWLGIAEPSGSFTSGGSEANATAVLVALQAAFPGVGSTGLHGLPGRPVFYASAESHLAWLKIAQQCGLGRDSVRLVPVDEALKLDLTELRRMVVHDRAAGALPFLLVATAGTTSAGVVDPLGGAAAVARAERLWLHVDAAWAGAAALSTRLRRWLSGVERADSVTVDAHKWLSVPMGAGMFITSRSDLLPRVFDVATEYMPGAVADGAADPYRTSMQWSRRAAGLKLFLALAVHGRSGYATQLEADTARAQELREVLRQDGWRIINDTPLPVVCFCDPSHSGDAAYHDAIVAEVVASGAAWVSTVRLAGRPAIRACVINHRTTPRDVTRLAVALGRARIACD